jgi:dTDP-4-amino-4,6-dideoxygalactose transaminase
VGCFSFFSNKNLTTGEGGMLVTDDDVIAEKLRLLRSHGMTTLTWDRHRGHAWSYDVVALGYNYRIDEIRAAIGRAQLPKLDRNNEQRRKLTEIYRERLAKLAPEVVLPFRAYRGVSSCHLFPILLPEGSNRVQFMELMMKQGIQTSVHYPPVHRFTYYQKLNDEFRMQNDEQMRKSIHHSSFIIHRSSISLPMTEKVAAREVTLPLYAAMNPTTVETVVQAVRHGIQELQKGQER